MWGKSGKAEKRFFCSMRWGWLSGFYRVCCSFGLEMRFVESIPKVLRATILSNNVRKRETVFQSEGFSIIYES